MTTGSGRPRRGAVVGLLVVVAGVFSYLIAYAGANALLAAELLSPWESSDDPRPRWFCWSFLGFAGLFAGIGVVVRMAVARDAVEEVEDDQAG